MSYLEVKAPGRPPKWDTLEELESLIEKYFMSCLSPVMETVENPEYDFDAADKAKENDEEYDVPRRIRQQKRDGNGNPMYEAIEPFTISGLAGALGTNRGTLLNYEKELIQSFDETKREQFSNAIKRAKGIVEQYVEKYMYTGKNQTSAIFVAKNNFGWQDRRETDITSKGEKITGHAIEFVSQDGK